MEETEIKYKPTERQAEAHSASEDFLLYGGGIGGGKTVCLAEEAYMCMHEEPGNRGLLIRQVAKHFRETTLETWKQNIPGNLYKINEQKQEIVVYTPEEPSHLLYGGFDKSDSRSRLLSLEINFLGIDQSEEIKETDFNMAASRLGRWKLPHGKKPRIRCFLTANPAVCWLKSRFISGKWGGYRFIQSLAKDNPHLPEDYVKRVLDIFRNQPLRIKALLEGNWDELQGANICVGSASVRRAFEVSKGFRMGPNNRVVSWDVARGGECRNVVYGFEGFRQTGFEWFGSEIKIPDGAVKVFIFAKNHGATDIIVDANGVGAGAADDLEKLLKGSEINLIRFNSAEKAKWNPKYYNKRSEMWWETGNLFADGKVGADEDEELLEELTSITYQLRIGKLLMDDKDDIKDILGRSPDKGDAFAMGIYGALIAGDRVATQKTSTQKWVGERELEMTGVAGSYEDMEQ